MIRILFVSSFIYLRKAIFSDKFGSLKIGLHHFCVFDHNCCEKLQFKNRCEIVYGCFFHCEHNDEPTTFTWHSLSFKHYSISYIETFLSLILLIPGQKVNELITSAKCSDY